MPKRTLSIRLSDELSDRLQEVAVTTGCSRTDIVSEALVRYLNVEGTSTLGDRVSRLEQRLAVLEERFSGVS